MGLDTSHDCWHGPYSAFHRWRCMLARAAGLPPLETMDGFYELPTDRDSQLRWEKPKTSSVKWETLKPDILHVLLCHSDCDGSIRWEDCGPLADRLQELIPLMMGGDRHLGNWRKQTEKFIAGLRLAFANQEDVEFM